MGHFDGGSSRNPGPGASAMWLEYEDGSSWVKATNWLGSTTNNKVKRIRVYGDSQLVVNQTLGNWKVREPDLKPLAEEAKRLAAKFESFDLLWIPRDQNSQCDALLKAEIKALSRACLGCSPC